ncbi:MAG: GIY-YIG nuclease family protein [Gammaproteobacteria bacterium]|nr:GIY-YIG nuclease family protein [Gammaproteobacteria bacterium]MDH5660637.1 GIY-YIG nuclease family protein [Gammaproteobacteria bacterium]
MTVNNKPADWFVYILECNDKTLYTGITNNIEKRIEQHNSGKEAAKYTRVRRPVKCVYKETHKNRSEATKREFEIKKLSRGEKLKLIKSM